MADLLTSAILGGVPHGFSTRAGGTAEDILPDAPLIVAKQGLGNMSVSNAFGSNTFNIFIALALPWFVGASRIPPRHALSCSDWRKWTRVSWHLLTELALSLRRF